MKYYQNPASRNMNGLEQLRIVSLKLTIIKQDIDHYHEINSVSSLRKTITLICLLLLKFTMNAAYELKLITALILYT